MCLAGGRLRLEGVSLHGCVYSRTHVVVSVSWDVCIAGGGVVVGVSLDVCIAGGV